MTDEASLTTLVDLAPVLSAYWMEHVLARLGTARVPRLWPGTTNEARRLAAAYADDPEVCEWLATRLQRITVAAWPHLTVDRQDDAPRTGTGTGEEVPITVHGDPAGGDGAVVQHELRLLFVVLAEL